MKKILLTLLLASVCVVNGVEQFRLCSSPFLFESNYLNNVARMMEKHITIPEEEAYNTWFADIQAIAREKMGEQALKDMHQLRQDLDQKGLELSMLCGYTEPLRLIQKYSLVTTLHENLEALNENEEQKKIVAHLFNLYKEKDKFDEIMNSHIKEAKKQIPLEGFIREKYPDFIKFGLPDEPEAKK